MQYKKYGLKLSKFLSAQWLHRLVAGDIAGGGGCGQHWSVQDKGEISTNYCTHVIFLLITATKKNQTNKHPNTATLNKPWHPAPQKKKYINKINK